MLDFYKRIRYRGDYRDFLSKIYPDWMNSLDKDEHPLCKAVTFQVTDACSLACTYCYQKHKGTKVMSWETAKLFVDKLLSGEDGFREYLGDSLAVVLEFIGGEPFLEIDLIDRIVDYFRCRAIELGHRWADNFMLSICSNGVAYNDPRVQKFLWKNRHCISFSISVDGTKALHDACRVFPDGSPSYDIAHAAAQDWMNKDNDMGSKITMAPSNVCFFADCLKQMVLDGYTNINANPVYEKGWTLDNAKVVWQQCKLFADWMRSEDYDQSKYRISFLEDTWCTPMSEDDNNNWCGGDGEMLACDPDGNLFPCLRYMESSLGDSQKPLMIGDVRTGLLRTEEQCKILDEMKSITRRSQSTDECFYCPVARGCSWCTAYNYEVFGTPNARCTYICDIQKARAASVVYYWNSYYVEKGLDKVLDLWLPRQWAVPIMGEQAYEDLVMLTKQLDGFVNESDEMIKDFDYKDGVRFGRECTG